MTAVLTIASLVAQRSLGLRVLTEGATGATEQPVRWVHNTELLDPSPYLRVHELVVTNGLWYDGPASATEFVGNVKRPAVRGSCSA